MADVQLTVAYSPAHSLFVRSQTVMSRQMQSSLLHSSNHQLHYASDPGQSKCSITGGHGFVRPSRTSRDRHSLDIRELV